MVTAQKQHAKEGQTVQEMIITVVGITIGAVFAWFLTPKRRKR